MLQRGYGLTMVDSTAVSYADVIDAWSSEVTGYGWTGLPDEIDVNSDMFTAASGGVSWTSDDTEWTGNQTITDRRVEISLDGRHWTAYDGQPESGTLSTPFVGDELWCAFSKQNASGWGPRSASVPFIGGGSSPTGNRNVITPTATGSEVAAAPVSLTAPTLMVLQYPGGGTERFTALSGDVTLTDSQARLWVGAGLHSGHPAPTTTIGLEYEATSGQSDWTDLGTGQDWNLLSATVNLTGKRVRGYKTSTNASGSITEYTNIATIPAATAWGAGVEVDFTFTGFESIHHPTEFAYIAANSAASLSLNTVLPFGGSVTGGVIATKSGQRPGIEITIPVAAGTYDVDLSVISGLDLNGDEKLWNGAAIEVAIYNQSGGTELFLDDATTGAEVTPTRTAYSANVTTTGGLFITIRNMTSTGSGSGGDVVLDRLVVEG